MTATVRLKQELGDAVELAFSPTAGTVQRIGRCVTRSSCCSASRRGQQRLVLFLDEFQELAAPRKPYGNPDAVTRQLRAVLQDSPAVTVLFAGSIEHVMRDLFGPADRALSQFGSFYELPPIAPDGLDVGIPARLKLDHCTIDNDALGQLIDRGEGHPRATMLIAQQAHYVATLEPTRRSTSRTSAPARSALYRRPPQARADTRARPHPRPPRPADRRARRARHQALPRPRTRHRQPDPPRPPRRRDHRAPRPWRMADLRSAAAPLPATAPGRNPTRLSRTVAPLAARRLHESPFASVAPVAPSAVRDPRVRSRKAARRQADTTASPFASGNPIPSRTRTRQTARGVSGSSGRGREGRRLRSNLCIGFSE